MKQKPTRDIEVGDRITRTGSRGEVLEWILGGERGEEPGDAEALQRTRDVNRLRRLVDDAAFGGWPIEDVRRVLAAWPGETK